MTLVLDTLNTVLEEPGTFIQNRTHLDLPCYSHNFPFSHQQKQAVELILSNAPIVAIAGLPGSGKTAVALGALETAIQHQRSTLVLARFKSSFHPYEQLSNPPLEINPNVNYRQNLKAWIQRQLSHAQIKLHPIFWLDDQLFEKLYAARSFQDWLNILTIHDPNQKKQEINQVIKQVLPDIHPKRQELLVDRFQKSISLIQQREKIRQNYITLSNSSFDQIVDCSLSYLQAPILCLFKHLQSLENRTFDLVIVEDSQYLNHAILQTIAPLAKKLVLLGELTNTNNLFDTISCNLYPAYRLALTENHRLHPELARKVFPNMFAVDHRPYTPVKAKHTLLPPATYHLTWINLKLSDLLLTELQESITKSNCKQPIVLTFSRNLADRLQTKISQSQPLTIAPVQDWIGKECEALWIVCDKADQIQPSHLHWQLALTRASQMITVLGDFEFYQHNLGDLSSEFHLVRKLRLRED